MKIRELVAVAIEGSYYYEDIETLQQHPTPEAERYTTQARTAGFRRLRETGEAISLGLVLEDGFIAWGDCVGVVYGGKAGRDPILRSQEGIELLKSQVFPSWKGKVLRSFKELSRECSDLPIPLALRYGLSQALLQACAHMTNTLPVQVICKDWGLPTPRSEVPLHAMMGTDAYSSVDKMLCRRVDSLPHGQIDDIPQQLGTGGETLIRYTRWIRDRVSLLSEQPYHPTMHLDLHGALGKLFEHDLAKTAQYILELEKAAAPYPLRLESVVVARSLDDQIQALHQISAKLLEARSKVCLVADEWANTLEDIRRFADAKACQMIQIKMPDLGCLSRSIEAVLYCKSRSIQTLLGGSCNETDLSARLTVHLALATQPTAFTAKPGLGVDEAVALARNEMRRTLAALANSRA